jgi:hypothetical protein
MAPAAMQQPAAVLVEQPPAAHVVTTTTATALVPVDDAPRRLQALAETICAGHAAVRGAMDRAIDVGNALREAKGLVPHGTWLRWLEENTPVTDRQSQKYMRLARLAEEGSKYELGFAFSLNKALAAHPSTKTRAVVAKKPEASKPAKPRRKGMAPDMRAALEAMETDPDLHRDFVLAAAARTNDCDVIVGILRAMLGRCNGGLVIELMVEALEGFDPPIARHVVNAMTRALEAQGKAPRPRPPDLSRTRGRSSRF